MSCLTCDLIAARDAGIAPLWDSIYRTEFWDLVHSFNTSLPGWLVLVARRHIEAIDELTNEEAAELGYTNYCHYSEWMLVFPCYKE